MYSKYYERSWKDALKDGFLSSSIDGTDKYVKNIQVGDDVYCHIAGYDFVGIGECTANAIPMKTFTVNDKGEQKSIMKVKWGKAFI